MSESTQTKRCPRCQLLLPPASFYRSSRSEDGRSWSCKDCERAYHVEWRRKKNKNRERLRALFAPKQGDAPETK